jgi:hypothetical protein
MDTPLFLEMKYLRKYLSKQKILRSIVLKKQVKELEKASLKHCY